MPRIISPGTTAGGAGNQEMSEIPKARNFPVITTRRRRSESRDFLEEMDHGRLRSLWSESPWGASSRDARGGACKRMQSMQTAWAHVAYMHRHTRTYQGIRRIWWCLEVCVWWWLIWIWCAYFLGHEWICAFSSGDHFFSAYLGPPDWRRGANSFCLGNSQFL